MRSALIAALLCIAVSIPSFSQSYDEEAERLRQENDERNWEEDSLSNEYEEDEWEEQRRKQRWLENEEIRQANEQREWEARRRDQMRQDNERIERENEQRVLEAQRLAQLRFENEARERAIAKATALEVVMEKPSQSGVVEVPNILEQLRKLGQLKDSGYLTESEFQELKKKLLDDQN